LAAEVRAFLETVTGTHADPDQFRMIINALENAGADVGGRSEVAAVGEPDTAVGEPDTAVGEPDTAVEDLGPAQGQLLLINGEVA
jgi:hypothetical protein